MTEGNRQAVLDAIMAEVEAGGFVLTDRQRRLMKAWADADVVNEPVRIVGRRYGTHRWGR